MTRIRLLLLTAVWASLGLAGCHQRYFMTEDDFKHYRHQALNLPPQAVDPVDFNPHLEALKPATILHPEGQKRHISLAECVALSLENGRTGRLFADTPFFLGGLPRGGVGNAGNLSDSIRVFAFDPALQATEIEEALSKFDARWQTSMVWNKIDRPIGTALETFQAFGQNEILQDTASFETDLIKPLPTGGLAGITYRTDYELSNLNPRVNPAYRPSLEFSFEQPLLQGAGVAINQLRSSHPGSLRNPFATGGRVPGILLTRIAYDQSQVEFERQVEEMLFRVEEGYWRLYFAYWDLYSRETALRQAHEAWQIAKIRYDVGKVTLQDLADVEEQFQFFRGQRVQSLAGVLEAERRLRYLVGLPADDGSRLIPMDPPTIAPFQPDWNVAIAEALANRHELILTRQDIQAAQLAVIREKDFLLPDLRTFGSYTFNSVGNRLDGRENNNALRNLTEGRHQNWTLGARAEIPLGFREAHASVRRAELQLALRVAFLRDLEEKIAFSVTRSYRELFQFHEEIRIQRARRLAATQELELRQQEWIVGRGREEGGPIPLVLRNLLDAQRTWADALQAEQLAISNYNIALADFEASKGTMLEHDNVIIVEGQLPACAQARAAEHIRERLRSPILSDGSHGHDGHGGDDCLPCTTEGGQAVLPKLPAGEPVPLPMVLNEKHGKAIQQLPEKLSMPLEGKPAVAPLREKSLLPSRSLLPPVEPEPILTPPLLQTTPPAVRR